MNDLFQLCSSTGVSGFEFQLGAKVAQQFDELCDTTHTDPMGNVIGVLDKGSKTTVLLEAHLDEVGMMVQGIDDNGFVRFVTVGGIDAGVFPACEVLIHGFGGQSLFGVIGTKPPHLMGDDEMKKPYQLEHLFIDTGFTAQQLQDKIRVGDSITFRSTPIQLQNVFFASKSIDNRMGVFVLLQCLKRLKTANLAYNVVALCGVQEEVGCRGAKIGAYHINPDYAIVVDVTHGVSPYVGDEDGYPLGGGVAIGIGPNLDRALTKGIARCAAEHHIPHCMEVCAGNSGTDAWPIQITKDGVPCLLLSVPLRYMHTTVETAQTKDIDAVVDLICTFLEEGGLSC